VRKLFDIVDLHWHALPIYRKEQLTVRDELATTIDIFMLQGAIRCDIGSCG
jgi:hypothetical protein